MTHQVCRLLLKQRPSSVRTVARTTADGIASPAVRLLELRDAAHEQRLSRQALEACANAVEAQLHSMTTLVETRLAQVAAMATEIGLAVAREIVADALERRLIDPTPVVHKCLQAAVTSSEGAGLVVHVAPDDHARLTIHVEGVRVVPDPRLGPSQVRVETNTGHVAYDPLEVLQRVSDELRRELAGCP